VERDVYGRQFYMASLTGKDSRFEVQVSGFDGRIIGIHPVGTECGHSGPRYCQ